MNRSIFLWLSFSILIVLSSFAQNEASPSLYKQGKEAYRQGDYETAEKLLLQNLSYQETNPEATEKDKIVAQLLMGDVYRKQRIFAKAMPYYEKAMALSEAEKEDDLYFNAAQNRAFLYSKMYAPIRAINEFKRLLPLAEEVYGKESSAYSNLTMNIGIDYFKMGDYYRAEQQFLQALALYQKTSTPTSEQFNRIYSNMGVNYRKMGAYDKAIAYAEKALEIKLLNYGPDHPSVSKYHLNIGRIYRDMREPEKALPYLEKALSMDQQHFPENHPYVTGMKGEVANVLADLARYEEALTYYRASQAVDTQYIAANHPYLIASYSNIALVYMEMERYEDALNTHEHALNMLKKSGYVPPHKRAEMLQLLSKIYDKKGELEKALEVSLEGLQALAKVGNTNFGNELPGAVFFENKRLYIQLMNWIGSLYEKMGSITQASDAAQKAIEAVHILRRTYHSDDDRRFLNSELSGLFELAVRTAFSAYAETADEQYLKQAFGYMEAAKADVLKHAVNEGLALRSAGIPAALLDSLDDLSFIIGGFEDDLNDWLMSSSVPDISLAKAPDTLKSQLFEQKETYRALLRHIEQEYPTYHQLKFGTGIEMLPHIQAQLDQQQKALLSYFYDEEKVYVILLYAHSIHGFQLPHQGKLINQITTFRDFLKPEAALKMTPAMLEDFQAQSTALYDLLIAPFSLQQKIVDGQNLIIVPFGVLHYLPFEILHPPMDRNLPSKSASYLLKDYAINYALAASLWARNSVAPTKTNNPFTGFAPRYDSLKTSKNERFGFGALHWNVSEVQQAQALLHGQVFTNQAATEEQFRLQAPLADILHLSMHADVNDQLPMRSGLLFTPGADSVENGFLNLYEIYNLHIPAQTVVLNACNTGYGKLAKGEGVLSLSHAFLYAGCRNILLNLWLADDQASSQIVNGFYAHVQDGLPQEEALRQAKLAYLKAADPLRAHPYFWAGLVLQGGMEDSKTGFLGWWGVILLGGVLGLGMLIWFGRR